MIDISERQIRPGRQDVSDDSDVKMVAKLGCCVTACLYDPYVGLGGMNHFMLPPNEGEAERFGVQCMELLINALLRRGAKREHLVARLFGGASLQRGTLDLGQFNAQFLQRFITNEGLSQGAGLLLPAAPLSVVFRPTTGKAIHKLVHDEADAIFAAELNLQPEMVEEDSGDLELF